MEIDGGTTTDLEFIIENRAEGWVRPEPEVPAVVVVQVAAIQPEGAPEEEAVLVAEVAQVVVVAPAAVALVVADDPSAIYLS